MIKLINAKKIYILLFCIFQTLASAQSQDLATLAKGDYLGFNALFDQKDNLFGYFTLFGYGKSGDKTKKFQYVILEKNFNPIGNKNQKLFLNMILTVVYKH